MSNSTVRTGLTVAVLTASAAATTLAGAPSASAAPAAPAAPVAATAAVKTSRMDIDGDGRRDTTTLTLRTLRNDRGTYTLETRTARGTRAATTFTVEDNGGNIDDVWHGAAGLDGTPGAEIVVNPSPVGDGLSLRVYRWSRGKLVPQAAPGRRAWRSVDDDWHVVAMPWGVQGYTFSTKRGVRYVVRHELHHAADVPKLTGTHTTYRWNKTTNAWTKVSIRRAPLVGYDEAAERYAGLVGVTLR